MEEPSPYRRIQLERYDPEALQEIISGADLDHILLKPGPSSCDVEQVECRDICLDRGRYSFATMVRGAFPPKRLCIGMVDRMQVPTWINGHEVGSSQIQVYAENSELFYRAGPRAAWATISVHRDQLKEAALRQFGRPLSVPRVGVWNLTPSRSAMNWLKQAIQVCLEESRSGARRSLPDLDSVLVDACAVAIASASIVRTSRPEHRHQVISRADRLMRRRVGKRYSSRGICQALGISERKLQMHFSTGLGISPKAWHQRLALHEARKELIRRDPVPGAVTDAALRCGFDHFGRFSVIYRDLFGESPSETLRR